MTTSFVPLDHDTDGFLTVRADRIEPVATIVDANGTIFSSPAEITIVPENNLINRVSELIFQHNTTVAFLASLSLSYSERTHAQAAKSNLVANLEIGDTEPAAPTFGLIWVDTSSATDAAAPKIYDGSAFVENKSAFDLLNEAKLDATQGALIDLINMAGGDIAAIRTALDVPATGDVALNFADLGGIPNTLAGYGITDAATSAQGLLADSAVQPADLAVVATSGDFGDLINAPTTLLGYGITDGITSAQSAADILAASNNVLLQIRGGVDPSGDDLAKLLALLLVERGRIDNILGGADAARDTFAEISALLDAEDAEDAATVAALMTSIAGRLEASQGALINLINLPGGNKADIRTALDVPSNADLTNRLDAKQDVLTFIPLSPVT